MKKLLTILLPDRNPDAKSFWCRLGLHRWDPASAQCEDCSMIDRLLVENK